MYYHRINLENKQFPYDVGHYDLNGKFHVIRNFRLEENASKKVLELNSCVQITERHYDFKSI